MCVCIHRPMRTANDHIAADSAETLLRSQMSDRDLSCNFFCTFSLIDGKVVCTSIRGGESERQFPSNGGMWQRSAVSFIPESKSLSTSRKICVELSTRTDKAIQDCLRDVSTCGLISMIEAKITCTENWVNFVNLSQFFNRVQK